MKSFEKIHFNKTRNHDSLTNNNNIENFFSSINNDVIIDSTLNDKYKKFYLKQINVQLDSKMLALIAKLHEDKIFEDMKSHFDADKKILLDKTKKKLQHSNSDYIIYNHLNLRNFNSKLKNNYVYDAADNLFMHSFFDKIKTRKRKEIKKKKNYYIDVLYQGSSSSKENILKMKREKPKYDYKLLLKSSSDLEDHYKKKESDLNINKINFDKQFSTEDINKEDTNTKELNETTYKTNNKEPIDYKNKTLYKLIRNTKGKNAFNYFPNINSKSKIDINKYKNIDKINEKRLNNNSNEKYNQTMLINKDKTSVKMELSKNNMIKITYFNNEKPYTPPKKILSKTTSSKFMKDKTDNTIKFRLNESERIQYMNQLQKQKFKKVITDLNQKEKNINQKFNKINKLIIKLKNKSPQQNQEQKIIDPNKEDLNSNYRRLKNLRLYKVWNEATSLFHFPLINNVIYENKRNFDGIDKIKADLKEEYLNKLKKNKKQKKQKIDGKIIMEKLHDKFFIEKLKDIAFDLKEKQRKKEQFEVYEL